MCACYVNIWENYVNYEFINTAIAQYKNGKIDKFYIVLKNNEWLPETSFILFLIGTASDISASFPCRFSAILFFFVDTNMPSYIQ